MRNDVFLDQQGESAVRQAGAATLDVTQLFESTRSSATVVSGAFTADTRANRLAAVGMQSGDEWLETDTGWLYYHTGLAWAYKTGINTGTDAARGAITPASNDNGALFYTTDTGALWEVSAAAWVNRFVTVSATTEFKVGVNKVVGARGAAVADVASADATDLASAITLANETKAQLNTLLARVRAATGHGLIA